MSSFYCQLKAVTLRNFLLKKYNKSKTFQEIFIPLYLILIIYALRFAGKTKPFESEDSYGIGNITDLWKPSTDNVVGFVLPNNSNEDIVTKVMSGPIFGQENYQSVIFKNVDELNEYNEKNNNLIGIIFDDNLYSYTIRINGTQVPDPEDPPISNYGKTRAEPETIASLKYLNRFAYLQSHIDASIISLKTNKNITINTVVGKLSKPQINYMSLTGAQSKLYSMYMNFLFISHIIVIVSFLVEEKEKRIKEGMLMAGVHSSVFWLSWEIIYTILIAITTVLITLFLYVTKSFEYINPIILFIIILLYGLSNCGLGFILSTFFKKAKTASSFAGIMTSVVFVLYFAFSYLKRNVKLIISIFLSPVAMGNVMEEIVKYEDDRVKVTFGSLFKTDIGIYIIILLVNNVIYFGLAVLFEYLFDEYSPLRLKRASKLYVSDNQVSGYEQDIEEDSRKNEQCSVEISDVSKQFIKEVDVDEEEEEKKSLLSKDKERKEAFLAVNHVNFKVYKNEIFAILGHNGAGKTTLLQIMIGLISASGGNVYYDGADITKNTIKIRKDFGICPQTNILFDELTVEDHIKIFAMIKNTKVDINEILREVDLEHKKDDKVSNLSGGQKRKLCIALAIIGNPKYIFLDEPTTGLDPLSRRKIWELLLNKRKDRVIFLTTHYMDEADILADRKLILSHGKIRCLGSSLYLKNHFNMQYSLDIESRNCDKVNDIIMKYIPESTFEIDNEKQIKNSDVEMRTWKLPLSSTKNFSNLFNELESLSGENNLIQRYALSMPSLEELFIRLEDDEDIETKINNNLEKDTLIINTNEKLPKLNKITSISTFDKIISLIKFRIKIFFHNKTFASTAIILPVLTSVMTFAILKLMNNIQIQTFNSKEISPSLYNNTIWNIESNNINIPNFKDTYSNIVGAKVAEYNDEELNNIGKTINNEPYYVSSISGTLENDIYNFLVYYNESMTHALPATLNAVSNSILASNNINERIITKSHPFSYGNYDFITISSIIIGIYIGAALISGASLYGPLIVRERVNQLLQQLQLNGVSRNNYWISSLLTDSGIYIITSILVLIVGIIFQPDSFLNAYILVILFITIIIWSMCTILYQYIISFLFNKEDTANSFIPLLNILPSYIGVIAFSLINAKYMSNDPSKIYSNTAIIVEVIITLINPPYAIMGILNAILTIKFYTSLLHIDLDLNILLRLNSGISPLIIVLIIDFIIYFFLLIKLDCKKNQTNANDIHEPKPEIMEMNEKLLKEGDEDVYNEYKNVKDNYLNLPISALQISKEYKIPKNSKERKNINESTNYKYGDIHKSLYYRNAYVKTAVEDVSFGVNQHECFGLLGPNGAGKSTTLNMITSTIPQTTGKICYNGVESHIARLNETSLGYCPQNDTYWKELTIREHIEFFLKIRGYSPEEAKEYATLYINCCKLEEHQNKRASKLSGGTKRKLCLLMAICGYPNQILLDEPTAGMDPSTRRYVWNIIKETKRDNDTAFIMTTHSMEEAENLCDRIGILINGRLKCIGSPEHIKMKYGNSYNLEVQSKDIETFVQNIEKTGLLGNDFKKEIKSHDRINYEIIIQHGVGKIFEVMESYKASGLVSDYSFSQTTLEQVFINFAKLQITNDDSN